MAKKTSPKETEQTLDSIPDIDNSANKIAEIEKNIETKLAELSFEFGGIKCMPLFMGENSIGDALVDDVFDDLRANHQDCNGKLNVIVESGGGDLDAAYNVSLLLRRYATAELNFIIPRWAKSAATLLVCSGDNIYMTPVAELGPLDPQITEFNPIDKRLEQFSPLSIEATLELIRGEYKSGNDKLAKALMDRLQFPLTLGGFKKSLENAEQYLEKLLATRMFKDVPDSKQQHQKIKGIANHLVRNYSHHGFCINNDEANSIGLKTHLLEGKRLDIVWEMHKLNKQKNDLKKEEMMKEFEGIMPPELLEKLKSKGNKKNHVPVNNEILN